MKRKLLVIFTMIFALVGTITFAVACGKDPVEEPPVGGPEVGEYYCDVEGREYTLTLGNGKYTLVLGGDPITGDYRAVGDILTLVKEGGDIDATYRSDAITLTYGGRVYKFLRKIEYTVTFDTGSGSAVPEQKILNGRKLQKPEDPTLDGQVFVGWYSDKEHKTFYNFNEPVISSFTLYARFVKAVEGEEYTVTFDLGYEGAETLPTKQTVGGILYDLPQPERDGIKFIGWWVSHYEDREKLTYQYHEQKLSGPTTLFAVWESDAPVVSVEESGITWSAPGVNNSYTLKIVGPNGNELYNQKTGLTSYTFDFANAEKGDYIVSVTLSDKTTQAFYRNKQLAKPSALRIEESTFVFDPVEHAESYTLTVVCGSEDHNHDEIQLGNKTSWSFENCEIPENGFVFTVTAQAEGWFSATSEQFVHSRELNKVSDLSVDPQTDVVNWSKIPYATSYLVTVKSEKLTHEETVHENSFSLTSYAPGDYHITVKPVARGWFSPEAQETDYTKTRLPAPENLHIENTTIVWNSVDGAQSYEVKIGDKTHSTSETKFEFTEDYVVDGQPDYPLSVRALGKTDSEHSFFCEIVVAHYGTMTTNTLVYRNGVLSWEPIFGVSQYKVTVEAEGVDSQELTVENAHKTPITFKGKGKTTLTVCAIRDSAEEKSFSIEVEVYELSFDSQGGKEVPSIFLAQGDSIPSLTKPTYGEEGGYDFYAWYTTPGGASDGGLKFEDEVFNYESDKKLYAEWKAQKYKITFDKGAYGAAEMDPQDVEYRASEYDFPVPESITPEMAFAGWYSDLNGSGTQYTDYKGHSLRAWTEFEGRTLYAHWVAVFTFEKVSDGYSVSKGPGISYVGEITIPERHGDDYVTTINDFSNLKTLLVVNFPDTVKSITLGSIGIAFSGCNNLQAINVIKVAGAHDPIYWSEDGVLLGKTQATGDVEIIFYPKQHDISKYNNVYTVPDGVTRIGSQTFVAEDTSMSSTQAYTIREIVLPASVREVAADAFHITTVRVITFLDPADGSAGETLTIEDNAFQKMYGLTTLNLPARLADFRAAMIDTDADGASRLSKINIADGGKNFASVEGLPCKILSDNGRELLFYPVPTYADGSFDALNITEVKIPDGITSIAANVVPTRRIEAITKLTIARTVTDIAANAFAEFKKLATIEFNGGADDLPLTIGERAFYGVGLPGPELALPENLVTLGAYAFGGNKNITTVTVNCGSKGALKFADNAFATSDNKHTSYIETVKLGPNVSEVNIAGVFGGAVKKVEVAEGNPNYKSEDDVLFNGDMTEIVFYPDGKDTFEVPATVTSIAANLFKDKKSLSSISFPASLTAIGASAFEGCTDLTTVTFRSGAEDGNSASLAIGARAFYGCKELKQISLPTTLKEIGSEAFASGGLTNVTLNEGLEKIGYEAFKSLPITTVTIPSTVKELGTTSSSLTIYAHGDTKKIDVTAMKVFDSCSSLTEIKVDENNANYASKDGVLYAKADGGKKELLYCPQGKTETITVPSDTSKIWSNAFENSTVSSINFEGNNVSLELAPKAFTNAKRLTSLTLPEGTKEIPECTFQGCTALTSVTVPTTVTRIGESAFSGCSKLTTVTFTSGGETGLVLEGGYKWLLAGSDSISNQTGIFTSCPLLTSLTLPERTTEIGDCVFFGSSLTTVNIPKNVTRIGVAAFAGSEKSASKITSLSFPEGSQLVTIDRNAFYNTPEMENSEGIAFPASLRTIGRDAFVKSGLSKITFNEGLETIGDYVFCGSDLEGEIEIPVSVKTIGAQAFSGYQGSTNYSYGPTKITSVTFAAGSHIETIGVGAFGGEKADKTYENTTLTSVNFGTPVGPFTIEKYAFAHCSALTTVTLSVNVESIGEGAFSSDPALNSVTFGEETCALESIGDNAFKETALKSFSFPNTDAEIELGKALFAGCENLSLHLSAHINSLDGVLTDCKVADITVDEHNEHFHLDEDNGHILYDSDGSVILVFGELEGSLTIGGNKIAESAFRGQTKFTSVTIGATVTEIGANAFNGCTGLQTVTFADGSGLNLIGANAFQGCTSLTQVNFGPTNLLSEIGNYAFDGCTQLSDVNFEIAKDHLTTIGKSAFRGTALTSLDLSQNTALKTIGQNSFENTSALTTVKFPNSLTFIGQSAFASSGLTSVDLSQTAITQFSSLETTTAKADSLSAAFKNCKELETVKLPAGLVRIGKSTFEGCEKLKTINLENVSLLGDSAFKGCVALDVVTLSSSDIEIGKETFHGCDALKTIELTNVYKIGDKAFAESGLTSVKIPKTITVELGYNKGNFGSGVFEKCTKLAKVEIEEGVKYLRDDTFNGCSALESVTLPSTYSTLESDTSYSDHVFANCTKLTSVEFADNATEGGLCVAPYMFSGCTALKTVKFGKGLKIIGKNAFEKCTELDTVNYADDISGVTFKDSVFLNCGFTTVTIPNATAMGKDLFKGNTKLTQVTFADDFAMTALPSAMFDGCTALTTFTFPDSVTSTGTGVLKNTGLTSVTFNKVTEIGANAFDECTKLETVTFPSGVTSIGKYAFRKTGLKSVELPEGLSTLGEYAFANCTSITALYLPSTVEKLKGNIFSGWTSNQKIYTSLSQEEFEKKYGTLTGTSATFEYDSSREKFKQQSSDAGE